MKASFRLCALVVFLSLFSLCELMISAKAQSPDAPTAQLDSPPTPTQNQTFVWYLSLMNPPTITIKGSHYKVSATGTAGTNFQVDWNMWLKLNGSSVIANDTSSGFVTKTFDANGKWSKNGWGTGTAQWSDVFDVTYGEYRAEAAAIITVGTMTRSTIDRRNFLVVMVPF